jgi:hypothetical protein
LSHSAHGSIAAPANAVVARSARRNPKLTGTKNTSSKIIRHHGANSATPPSRPALLQSLDSTRKCPIVADLQIGAALQIRAEV